MQRRPRDLDIVLMPGPIGSLIAVIAGIVTYAGIAIGRIPGLRMNRATIAIVAYLRAGLPITILTILAGIFWLSLG